MKQKKLYFLLINMVMAFIFLSCSGVQHYKDFELQNQITDDSDTTVKKQIYITSTKPIDSVDPHKIIFDIFRIDISKYPDSLKVYTRVYDSLGHFVTNMADPYKKDINIKYFSSINETLGKLYNVRNVDINEFKVREFGALDSIPYNIVMSVDYSGSMEGVKNTIFNGTELFVSLKESYDRIALTSFNKDFSVKVPFSNDKNHILNLYKTNREQGIGYFSAVNDAVYNCIKMFDNTVASIPRILVIFTDGDDNYSKKELGELIDSAKDAEIHIFTVAFGYSLDENLKYLAEYTGGKFYKARTNEELIAIFRDIYNSLKNYYLITYKPPKYWGYHKIMASLNLPGRLDTVPAYGEYNTSDLNPWDTINKPVIRPIFFDFDKAIIKPESFPVIDEIVDQMMSMPRLRLEIRGHTDNVGTNEYNQALSENRAKAVVEALIGRGIDSKRLRYRGFGATMPLAENTTEENRAKNRRTEFVILAK